MSSSPYSRAILADGPVGCWLLREAVGSVSAGDSALLPHPGTVAAGVAFGRVGAVAGDTAAWFDGVTGDITIAANAVFNFTGQVTLEGWVWADGLNAAGGYNQVIAKYTGANSGDYELYVKNDGSVRFFIRGSGLAYEFASAVGVVAVGQWYHLVGTYVDATDSVTVYVNGGLVAAAANPATTTVVLGNGSAPIDIGQRTAGGGGGLNWQGRLADLAVYAYALSAQQVANHYALGIATPPFLHAPALTLPYGAAQPITPNDAIDFAASGLVAPLCDAIYVGVGGVVSLVLQDGTVVPFTCNTGQILAMKARRVNASGTDAAGLLALYRA